MNIEELKEKIISIINDKKGFEIKIISVKNISSLAEYFIICEGGSITHMKTIADELLYQLKKFNIPSKGMEYLNSWSLRKISYFHLLILQTVNSIILHQEL